MAEKRQYNIDLLRILGCIMVLVLHVSGHHWGRSDPNGSAWQIFNIYNVMVRSAVPIFFMISGKLFLSRDDISIKHLFTKNIVKLILVYFIWSLFYAIDTIGINRLIEERDFSRLFSVFAMSKYHLWYLPALVSVYLLVPIFISMKSYKDGKILDYTAALFFAFAIVRYSVLLLPIDQPIKDILLKFNFAFDSHCGFFLSGYLLDKNKEKLKRISSLWLIVIYAVTVILTALASYFLSVKAGTPVSDLYNNFFISTYIEAIAIFLLFLRIPQSNLVQRCQKLIKKISGYTLFIYVFHPFVIEHLILWFGFDTLSLNPIISVPLITLVLFAVCTAIAFVIEKIPVVNKLLL